jgi:RNA polymerase sigma-70 factor, ECF subfamily
MDNRPFISKDTAARILFPVWNAGIKSHWVVLYKEGRQLDDRRKYFELAVWPHLRSAYNVARWLVGNHQDAEDVVQESFTKAYLALERFRGDDARAWLLAIVRNTSLNFIQRRKPKHEVEWKENLPEPSAAEPGPEAQLILQARRDRVRDSIERLPREFREALVLREIEGMAYKEIAWLLKVPVGTVMSRLSRARSLLIQELVTDKVGMQ